jgi:hypothetical protein
MPLDFLNIVPENNLRLPEALNVTYGPAQPLSRFVLAADKAARRRGVFLRVRYDFDELIYANRQYTARGSWYPLLDGFNPDCADIKPENSFWIAGENAEGEIVVTVASRLFDFSGTSLARQARTVWFGRDKGQPCIVTAEAAHHISGIVNWGGSLWVRPDFRGRHLAYLMPRVVKAYSCSRWPIECLFCFVGIDNLKRGIAPSYGHQNLSCSIVFPGAPQGEQAVAYTMLGEFYAELANFMATGGDIEAGDIEGSATSSTPLEHIVTKTSADGVFHGSMSLS